ncbi:uncharacterized protein [Dermacentor albipictus]|uniref:uncharacterized protein isoform X2 n=1 Tax=Dermacentor albipictus TaxID=60249 RepID=UPI0038FD161E
MKHLWKSPLCFYAIARNSLSAKKALQEDAKGKLRCKPLLFMSPLLQLSYDHLWATHECTLLWTLPHHLCCKVALALLALVEHSWPWCNISESAGT